MYRRFESELVRHCCLRTAIAPKCCRPWLGVCAIRTRDFHFPSNRLTDWRGRLRRNEEVDDEVLVGSNVRDGLRCRIHSVVCGGCSRNGAGIRWHVSWKRSWNPGTTQHGKPDSKSAPGTRAATGHQWAAQSLRTPADGKRIAIVFPPRGGVPSFAVNTYPPHLHRALIFLGLARLGSASGRDLRAGCPLQVLARSKQWQQGGVSTCGCCASEWVSVFTVSTTRPIGNGNEQIQ
jgi:hypothetical protein